MQITIPKIVRAVALKEYAEELGEARVNVWVNPTRAVLEAYQALRERNTELNARLKATPGDATDDLAALMGEMSLVADGYADWYAALWSQGEDKAQHWTADEVRQVATNETDPGFYQWLTGQTWALISEHRAASKKK